MFSRPHRHRGRRARYVDCGRLARQGMRRAWHALGDRMRLDLGDDRRSLVELACVALILGDRMGQRRLRVQLLVLPVLVGRVKVSQVGSLEVSTDISLLAVA